MAQKPKLVLVDTMGIIHRAYHAYPELTTTDGKLINAVYGFGIMFLQILKNLQPEFLIFASDAKEKTFRSEKYADYKAHRGPMEETLVEQIPIIYDFISSTDLPLYIENGFEADDIIGSLATKYSKDYDVVIVTGDKDLLQLIDDGITVVLPGKTFSDMRLYHEKEFVERFGFEPKQYIDYKAIVGDPSDNIKGAKGIGDKTATDLIKTYYNLGGILQNLHNIKERQRKIIEEYKEVLITNLDIVTIHKSLDIDFDKDRAELKTLDIKSFTQFLKKYEFNSLLIQLEKLNLNRIIDHIYETEQNKERINFKQIKSDNLFESTYPNFLYFENKIFSFNENFEYKISIDLPTKGTTFNLKSYLHNFPKIDLKNEIAIDDLQLLSYCLNPDFGDSDIFKLYKKYFHNEISEQYEIEIEEDLKDVALKSIAFIKINEKVQIEIDESAKKVYKEIDLPLVPVLVEMEREGIRVNGEYLQRLKKIFDKKIEEIKNKIFDCVGHEFNPNSTKELSKVLFDELNLPKQKKIKTGFSTNERTISKLSGVHPIIELILEYREFTKLQSTYVDGLYKLIEDGRIHTDFRQSVVATGRLSSVNPNLQNIPTRSETGELIRKAFVADEGNELLSMDYSQIELRLMAEISGDEDFIRAFREEKDIHKNTASLMFGVSEDQVTSEQRRVAKMINFGIIYGISDFGLSDRLGNIDVKTAKEFIRKYFERYPKVKEYFDMIKEQVASDGFVQTLFGRKRYFNLSVGNYMMKQAMYREAVNMPIQGADADIVKMAMVKVQRLINEKYEGKVKMLLQIHDELLFEISSDGELKENFIKEAKNLMENIVDLKVPMIVNAKCGQNWGEMKEIVVKN